MIEFMGVHQHAMKQCNGGLWLYMSPRVVAVAAAGKEKERDAVAGMEVPPTCLSSGSCSPGFLPML